MRKNARTFEVSSQNLYLNAWLNYDGEEKEIVSLNSKTSIIEKGKLIKSSSLQLRALKFVLLTGVMSFFADFVYESSRGIIGPYLALLGASAFTVAAVTEFVGYAWRLVSGSLSNKTGQFWPITICGYIIQMASVPLLALMESWQMAATLIILEKLGRRLVTHRTMLCFLMLPKKWENMAEPLACMKHLTNLEHYSAHLLQPAFLPDAMTIGSLLPFYSSRLS
jgi:hypothetical protein